MPYCFWGSSIKFQGHTGWKIDEFNQIWVRLLGRSQLSNPSDLPCYSNVQTIKQRDKIHYTSCHISHMRAWNWTHNPFKNITPYTYFPIAVQWSTSWIAARLEIDLMPSQENTMDIQPTLHASEIAVQCRYLWLNKRFKVKLSCRRYNR